MGCCYKTLDAKTAELASYSQNYCPSGCAAHSSMLAFSRTLALSRTLAISGSNPRLGLHRLTGMRHMPDFVYELGVRLWQAAYERLPPDSRLRPPNVCILQTYVRSKGDFMRYHTDGRPSYSGEEEKIVQARGTGGAAPRAACHCAPALTLCPPPSLHPPPVAGPRHCRHDFKQTTSDAFELDEETLAELAALTEAMQVHPVEVS